MKINLPSIALITSVGTAIAASIYLHNAVSGIVIAAREVQCYG